MDNCKPIASNHLNPIYTYRMLGKLMKIPWTLTALTETMNGSSLPSL